ncbi:MAG: glycosyltransferase [Patescibacteria group bacterium]
MKIALVYDRVNKWGGAERVLLALHEIFPDAPLFTAVYSSEKAKWAKIFPKVIPSFLQKIRFTNTNHEFLGAFTPLAFESFDFDGYDMVISVTSEAAKGIITKPGTLHICYCLTPTRYLWSAHDLYFKNPPSKFKFFPFFWHISRPLVRYLKNWDKVAANRPDAMLAISNAVKERIKKYYGRDSEVIFPPVEVEKFTGELNKRGNFFLLVGRLIPYKRVDLAVMAFNKLGLPLVVVGTGSEERKLKRMAKDNIKFVGELTDAKLADYYRRCTALIFPQEEDFGIVTLEAQAAGAPVIAYRAGGALDTIIEGKTGVFFDRQNVESLIAAVKKVRGMKFKPKDLLGNAQKFSKENFERNFIRFVKKHGRF